ncbi:S-adenosylmethionine sensor upstream of mTORC1 isoform 1-T1 [Lycaon pictus]
MSPRTARPGDARRAGGQEPRAPTEQTPRRKRGGLSAPAHRAGSRERGAGSGERGRQTGASGPRAPPAALPGPASPAPSSCSPAQTPGCTAGAPRPLALSPFRFRPALQRPPIGSGAWARGHLRGRRFGSPGLPRLLPPLLLPPPSPPPPSGRRLRGPEGRRRRRRRRRHGAGGRRPRRCSQAWGWAPEHPAASGAGAEAGAGEALRGGEERPPAAPQEVPGSVCREYFQNGGKRKALEKDEKRAVLATKTTPALNSHESSKLEGHLTNLSFTNPEFITELLQTSGKIRLLDVGSCFNPFLKFEEFLTVGIDIVPAVESVYKCDFLNLQLQQPLQLAQDAIDAFLKQLKNPIDSLPGELFHVVVFSLLLSYFPSPYQRWICCKKAHELLVLNGLLLIITPDSSHQNRHAMMMKSWKIAIESLGFKRFKYSKFSHMHLMAFRKTSLKTTSDLVSRNYPGMLYIPQDFNSIEEEEYSNPSCYVRSDIEDEQLAYGFTELPDAPYDSDSGESQASSIPFYELEDPILLLS